MVAIKYIFVINIFLSVIYFYCVIAYIVIMIDFYFKYFYIINCFRNKKALDTHYVTRAAEQHSPFVGSII
jgi:hypothetical protein